MLRKKQSDGPSVHGGSAFSASGSTSEGPTSASTTGASGPFMVLKDPSYTAAHTTDLASPGHGVLSPGSAGGGATAGNSPHGLPPAARIPGSSVNLVAIAECQNEGTVSPDSSHSHRKALQQQQHGEAAAQEAGRSSSSSSTLVTGRPSLLGDRSRASVGGGGGGGSINNNANAVPPVASLLPLATINSAGLLEQRSSLAGAASVDGRQRLPPVALPLRDAGSSAYESGKSSYIFGLFCL